MNGRRAKQDRKADRQLRERWTEFDPLKPYREIIADHYRDHLSTSGNKMCSSCAFRDGETRTETLSVLNAMTALGDAHPFYCHQNMPIINGDFQPRSALDLILAEAMR